MDPVTEKRLERKIPEPPVMVGELPVTNRLLVFLVRRFENLNLLSQTCKSLHSLVNSATVIKSLCQNPIQETFGPVPLSKLLEFLKGRIPLEERAGFTLDFSNFAGYSHHITEKGVADIFSSFPELACLNLCIRPSSRVPEYLWTTMLEAIKRSPPSNLKIVIWSPMNQKDEVIQRDCQKHCLTVTFSLEQWTFGSEYDVREAEHREERQNRQVSTLRDPNGFWALINSFQEKD